jgi:hypothetical protein
MKQPHYILGMAFSLLSQIRAYLINSNNPEAVSLIEDQYQSIKVALEMTYQLPFSQENQKNNE